MLTIQQIHILDISKDDIETTCSSEFIEEPTFTLDFTNPANSSIVKFIDAIKNLSDNQNIWNALKEDGISSQHVQVWIFYVLHNGLLTTASFREKERAVLGAQLFFVLLPQPGSGGEQFHHSVLYETSINALKMVCKINAASSKGKRKKKTPEQNPDITAEETVLTTNQEVELLETFTAALKDFCRFTSLYSLKDQAAEFKRAVEALILTIKSFGGATSTHHSELDDLALPNQLAFQSLRSLVHPKHGKVEETSTLVFRLLMTTITMIHAQGTSSGGNIPRAAVRQAEAAMSLVSTIYDDHGHLVEHAARNLMQNILAQCPDRVEYKNHVATFVSSFIMKMPFIWYADFIGWLVCLSHHTKIGYRIAALTVIGQLLCQPEQTYSEDDNLTDEAKNHLSHKFLLEAVIFAITDIAPTVRAKALISLADVMEKHSVSGLVFSELLQDASIGVSPGRENTPSLEVTPTLSCDMSTVLPIVTPIALNSFPVPSLCVFHPTGNNLLSIIRERASEEKFVVRKSALQALDVALCNGYILPSKEALQMLDERCRDPLLSVRKHAIQTITNVLTQFPDNFDVQEFWMVGLLPSILDVETSMQEKAALLIENKILKGLLNDENVAWDLLKFLTTAKGHENRIYLQKVSKEWNIQGKLKSDILKKILNYLRNEKTKVQAWVLLSVFTIFTGDKHVASNVIHHWKHEAGVKNSLCLQMDMISTVGQVAKYMNDEDKNAVLGDLKMQIKSGRCAIQLIGSVFEAIYKIRVSQYPDRLQCKAEMDNWCGDLLTSSDHWLSDVVMTSSQANFDEDLLVNHLYVVGEAAQRCIKKVPKRLLLSIQALLTNPSEIDSSSQGLSQPLSQFGNAGIPTAIRAHAIFNLGRICFHHESLAKKCVPAMARELEICPNEEVRNNVLVILTDLCILQTQLVDPYLSEMASCLGDESTFVRKHAVILISSLIRKEYVKWKDTLLFKFLHVACDKDDEIRALARYFLTEQLLRGPDAAGNLFYRNFVACLFYYNAYDGHNVHKFSKNERERRLFDLSQTFDQRMEIYKYILTCMEDSHRINLTGKLCEDVLDAFVEDGIPLNKETQNLLTDTLSVLCCKEIRLKCVRSREDLELEEECAENPADKLKTIKAVAKQKLIQQTVKTHLVENIIPIIIALKNKLAELKSPFVKNVMIYLKEVMQEYRNEVKLILSADKQLANEIEFDLKRFDREQEMAQAALRRKSIAVPSRTATPIGTPQPNIGNKTPQHARTPQHQIPAITPATLKQINRPMNVQAIINSARKVLKSKSTVETDPTISSTNNEVVSTLTTPSRYNISATRAASTPQLQTDMDFTFAPDISAIAAPSENNPKLLLLKHPENTSPPRQWNVSSPTPQRTLRSNTSRRKRSVQK